MRWRDKYLCVIALLLMVPMIVWICSDLRMFVSDEGYFGWNALEHFFKLQEGFSSWIEWTIMKPGKSPLLYWIAQFVTPVGFLIGNVQIAYVLVNAIVSIAGAILFWKVSQKIFEAEWISFLILFWLISSPAFQFSFRTFYIQPLQLLLSILSLWVFLQAERWKCLQVISYCFLLGVVSIATQFTFPVVIAPVLIAAGVISTRKGAREGSISFLFQSMPILILGSLVLLWLPHNFVDVFNRAIAAISDHTAGDGDTYSQHLYIWLSYLVRAQTLIIVAPFYFGVILVLVLLTFKKRLEDRLTLVISISLGTILVVVLLYGFADQETFRYTLPLLPYVAIVIGALLKSSDNRVMKVLFGIVIAFQFLIQQINSFAWIDILERKDHPTEIPMKGLKLTYEKPASFEVANLIGRIHRENRGAIFIGTGSLADEQVNPYSENLYFYIMESRERWVEKKIRSIEFIFIWKDLKHQFYSSVEEVWHRLIIKKPSFYVFAKRLEFIDEREILDSYSYVHLATKKIWERVKLSSDYRESTRYQHGDEVVVYERLESAI